jgi:hypothetical protein
MSEILTTLNNKWGEYDLKTIDSRMGMIGGLIKNTTLTTSQENEFLYGGFTFAFDVN